MSRVIEGDTTITRCTTSNLCASKDLRVSDSGATVLRLTIELADGWSVDVVLKVLSPDSVNIFKIDEKFRARKWEIALMRWWGEQGIPQIPIIYDTRAEHTAREYWILHEYFPHIGWAKKGKSGDIAAMECLMEHVACLHAYSRKRIEELRALLSGDDTVPGELYTPPALLNALDAVLADANFLTKTVGLSDNELKVISNCMNLISDRPTWVDEWDFVCVNRDFSAINTAVKDTPDGPQLVSFDWGAAHIGPIEHDFDVLLGRDLKVDKPTQDVLVRLYLESYGSLTGHKIDFEIFMARIPWARLTLMLGYTMEHLNTLKWMPWQSRSVYFIHLFLDLAERIAAEIKQKK